MIEIIPKKNPKMIRCNWKTSLKISIYTRTNNNPMESHWESRCNPTGDPPARLLRDLLQVLPVARAGPRGATYSAAGWPTLGSSGWAGVWSAADPLPPGAP